MSLPLVQGLGKSLTMGCRNYFPKEIGGSAVSSCLVHATECLFIIQAMSSQAGGGTGGDAGSVQQGSGQGLARQGSLYNLTLDEVQSHLGEPLFSMNLDELLKSVFPGGADPDGTTAGNSELISGLQRQGSITMPPQLSKKTVDEVWKGIQDRPEISATKGGQQRQERQPTLGEMTLEDFLVKAGVVTDGYAKDLNDLTTSVDTVGSSVVAGGAPSLNTGVHWLQQYQQQALEPQQPSLADSYLANQLNPQPLSVAMGAILDSVYPDGQITSPMLGAFSDPQTPGSKRGAPGEVTNKVIERRQKRMIKNRESAARSRARKQV
jgi:ABA responsive element binding factor